MSLSLGRESRLLTELRIAEPNRCEFMKTFPDQRLVNRPYRVFFASGDWTCSIARFTGTMKGPMMEADGKEIPPTGKSFDVELLHRRPLGQRPDRAGEPSNTISSRSCAKLAWDSGLSGSPVSLADIAEITHPKLDFELQNERARLLTLRSPQFEWAHQPRATTKKEH